MQRDFTRIYLGITLFVFLAMITIPYLVAWMMGGEQWVFGGILLNPLDGNTYLAKIIQGEQGSWMFRLPYTAESEATTYIFIFYLGLGHLARLSGIPAVFVFHLARIAGGVFLFWSLVLLLRRVMPVEGRRAALILLVFGSGSGWLGAPFGIVSSDFWVAEAYPFLSAFINPHFPIGMGLLLILFLLTSQAKPPYGKVFICAFFLAGILPFGLVLAGMILAANLVLVWIQQRKFPRQRLLQLMTISAAGGVPALYYLYAIQSDPYLVQWNLQNITPSPPIWDLIISFSPALLIAVLVLVKQSRRTLDKFVPTIGLWLVIGAALIYIPWSLQRRFLMGYFLPCGFLAIWGMRSLGLSKWANVGLISASLLTNLVVMLTIFFGISTHAEEYYLTADEAASLEWISENTSVDDGFLAGEEMGLFIPAQTGRRVVYGHPYETVQAEEMRALVNSFYEGSLSEPEVQNLLLKVDYIFQGPRELSVGRAACVEDCQLVFEQGQVKIFSTR